MAYSLGDGCNLIKARKLKKPIEFYILFMIAEVYGAWAFWYCIVELKKDMKKSDDYVEAKWFKCLSLCYDTNKRHTKSGKNSKDDPEAAPLKDQPKNKEIKNNNTESTVDKNEQKKKLVTYFSDEIRKLVMLMSMEIPLIMILEYFYVERPLGSDGFFENKWIAWNNFLTSIEIIFLLAATIDLIADNFRERDGAPQSEAKGVGAPDGRLDFFEILIILNVICLFLATITRVTVNACKNAEWDDNFIKSLEDDSGCLIFKYGIAREAMLWYDWFYLIFCLTPLASFIPIFMTVVLKKEFLSKYIIYTSKNSDRNKLEYFKQIIGRKDNAEEFLTLVKNYDDEHLIFFRWANKTQNEFIESKNKIAFHEAVVSKYLSVKEKHKILEEFHKNNSTFYKVNDDRGYNLLTLACRLGLTDTVDFMIKKFEIDANLCYGKNGKNGFLSAAEGGHKGTMHFLNSIDNSSILGRLSKGSVLF